MICTAKRMNEIEQIEAENAIEQGRLRCCSEAKRAFAGADGQWKLALQAMSGGFDFHAGSIWLRPFMAERRAFDFCL